MNAVLLVAFVLLTSPNAYTDRLHARGETSRADPAVTAARRIEAQLRARVRFETDPENATVRIVIQGEGRRVSIAAFRHNAVSWTLERVELQAPNGAYDRATPFAISSQLSPADVARLEALMRARTWSTGACRSADRVVMTVRFADGVRNLSGCPADSAADALWILDAGGSEGAH